MADIKNWVKVMVLDIQRKFVLCSKCGKWVSFGTEINPFYLFLKIWLLAFSEFIHNGRQYKVGKSDCF